MAFILASFSVVTPFYQIGAHASTKKWGKNQLGKVRRRFFPYSYFAILLYFPFRHVFFTTFIITVIWLSGHVLMVTC